MVPQISLATFQVYKRELKNLLGWQPLFEMPCILSLARQAPVLDPKNYYKDGNEERLRKLCDVYAKDIELKSVLFEYPALMSTLHGIFKTGKDLPKSNDVLAFLIETGMENLFPNMCTLYRIFLTTPVSSVHAERSFNCLKLIKTYLRSDMGQEHLSSLSLLSIE